MPWSIFSDGGGDSAAVTWAKQLLQTLGAPLTSGNISFIYDWEKAEGGGGKYNPLNQGPDPRHPNYTTTGEQYGGGAADYASWQDGILGAADYLHMGNYKGVLNALLAGDPAAARSALIASPWAASHYDGGASFPDTPAPDAGGPNAGNGYTNPTGDQNAGLSDVGGALSTFGREIRDLAIITPFVLGGLVLVVMGIGQTSAGRAAKQAISTGAHGAALAAEAAA
jgi:hypothetical protein